MSQKVHRRDDAACIIVNIDQERTFWKSHYGDLPCTQAGDGFEACWPLLVRAYHLYLHHPHVGRDVGAVMYANAPEILALGLDSTMAGRIFSRVMDRIHRATVRLEYPNTVRA
jgi:hypothetical protein